MQVIFRIHPELFAQPAGSLEVLCLQVGELLEGLSDLGPAEGLEVEADDGNGPGGQAIGAQCGLGRTKGQEENQGKQGTHDGRALSLPTSRGQEDRPFP